MTKSICLRFNLDKPLHREAWEQLQNMDKEKFKSYTNAVVEQPKRAEEITDVDLDFIGG